MQIEFGIDGIYLPQLDLWLDPAYASSHAWLSHAHSDHARGYHEFALATPATLALYRDRWPDQPEKRRVLQPLPFGESFAWRGACLTALPAGHILGAAQLLIEFENERVLYTGDIKLTPPLCGLTTRTVPCDRLIIESTFGLPIFHFLPAEEARQRIIAFARDCLARGESPVFQGYPLGRGQEIAHVLTQAGLPTAIHGAIARYLPYYEEAGYTFPGWQPYQSQASGARALVVTPSHVRALADADRNTRMAYVSGWAALSNARARAGAEELIPYSDHASFTELLGLVEASGARQVDVVHGYAEAFAGILRARGLDAHPRQARTAAGEEEVVP
jgi:Cft2 family RNA processing exonuclease